MKKAAEKNNNVEIKWLAQILALKFIPKTVNEKCREFTKSDSFSISTAAFLSIYLEWKKGTGEEGQNNNRERQIKKA